MSLSDVQDRLVKAYNFPLQTTEDDLRNYFAKLGVRIAGVQRYQFWHISRLGQIAYIVFEENVDADTVHYHFIQIA